MSRSNLRSLVAAAPTFSALGDPTRLRIVAQLSESGPLSIAQLSAGADMSRQGLTKHLQVLEEAGLVTGERRGRENVYELKRKRLQIAERWLSTISREWDETLTRLQAFVESDS